MFKKLSKLIVIFTIILSLSLSLIACGDGDDTETQALPEWVNPQAYTGGIHDYTNTDSETEWLVKDGKTDYVLYVPAIQSQDMKTAIQDFKLLFFDATNINIVEVLDTTPANENAKYISLGENALFESIYVEDENVEGYDPNKHITVAEFDKANLKEDGLRILTKGKNVFLLGGMLDDGVANAVYTFMTLHFNFEYFYRNCIVIDENVTDEKLKIFNVKDVPDIDRRSYNVVWYSTKFNAPRGADLKNGLEVQDIINRRSRSRLTGGESELLPALAQEGWKGDNTAGRMHNVQEYFTESTNEDSTLYVNYNKYFYDEYMPEGIMELEPFAPSRYAELIEPKYGVDSDGDCIPDSWQYGNGDSIGAAAEHGYVPSNGEVGDRGSQSDWWNGVTVCHTAHGNKNSYEALKKRVAEVIMMALRKYPREKYPERNVMLFSMEDAGVPCMCIGGCKIFYDKFEAHTAAISAFLNDVMRTYIRPWMQREGNEDYRRDNFVLSYFCYSSNKGVPTCNDEQYREEFETKIKCDPNVGVYIAGIDGLFNNTHMQDAVCQYEIEYLNKWDSICDNIMIWAYSVNAYSTIFFSDTLACYSSEFYQQLANIGVFWMFNESQDLGDEAPCWQNWSSYYQSKLMWDSTLDTGPLMDAYFDAMYLDASDTMKEIYNRMRVHRQVMQDEHSIRDQVIRNTQICQTKFWSLGVVTNWWNMFEQAMSEIEKYKTLDPDLYDWLEEHIELEMMTPAFIAIYLYSDKLTPAETKKYIDVCYSVTETFPSITWKGSFSSNIRTHLNTL